MPLYMYQAAYTPESWAAQIKNPWAIAWWVDTTPNINAEANHNFKILLFIIFSLGVTVL